MIDPDNERKITVVKDVYGEDEIRQVYGDPSQPIFKSQLVRMQLPFPLYGDWGDNPRIEGLLMHPLVVDSLHEALTEILELVGAEKLREQRWDVLGDAYSYRRKKGGNELSTHSWGIAIDLNPHLAPWLKKPDQPKVIVDAFIRRGWEWGGKWRNVDGMHFQAARNY